MNPYILIIIAALLLAGAITYFLNLPDPDDEEDRDPTPREVARSVFILGVGFSVLFSAAFRVLTIILN